MYWWIETELEEIAHLKQFIVKPMFCIMQCSEFNLHIMTRYYARKMIVDKDSVSARRCVYATVLKSLLG